jgi:hypothetical protein
VSGVGGAGAVSGIGGSDGVVSAVGDKKNEHPFYVAALFITHY